MAALRVGLLLAASPVLSESTRGPCTPPTTCVDVGGRRLGEVVGWRADELGMSQGGASLCREVGSRDRDWKDDLGGQGAPGPPRCRPRPSQPAGSASLRPASWPRPGRPSGASGRRSGGRSSCGPRHPPAYVGETSGTETQNLLSGARAQP